MGKKYLSTSEVAKILGISRVAVFKKIKAGQLKAQLVGKSYVIDPKQLGLYYNELKDADKKVIQDAVRKVLEQYGEAIRKLGKE